MKKHALSLGFLGFLSLCTWSQPITETVSVGSAYQTQKWYSLQNGEVGAQPKDNWDLAFEISGYSSAIFANTQKSNFAIYKAPYAIASYASLDTTGISGWVQLYNSDTTWTIGAFNKGANPSNPVDLGWGLYDMNTHVVSGDSCYIVKLSANSYKKLKIESLSGGIYTFEYADINGANSYTQTISKSAYSGKNFVYADLSSHSLVDREPVSASWDLTFGRYTAMLMMPALTPYAVVGVLSNKGVSVAQADNVPSAGTYTNFSSEVFNTNISVIGHDWKTFDLNSNSWKITSDTLYFINDKAGAIWKLRFLSFGGSATGDVVFSKEKLQMATVGLDEWNRTSLRSSVYPNPVSGGPATLVFSSDGPADVNISLCHLNGTQIYSEQVQVYSGMNLHHFNVTGLNPGLYLLKIDTGIFSSIQKLIIQ